MAQLMPLPLTVSCSSKIQIGFTFLVPAYLGSPGKMAVKTSVCGVSICPGEHMSVNQAHCMLDSLRLLRENETLYVKVGDVGGIQYYYHLKR